MREKKQSENEKSKRISDPKPCDLLEASLKQN